MFGFFANACGGTGLTRLNGLDPGGNLYKVLWFGQGLVGQHEKRTRVHDGHDDLVKLVNALNGTKGEEQWAVIKKNFVGANFILLLLIS